MSGEMYAVSRNKVAHRVHYMSGYPPVLVCLPGISVREDCRYWMTDDLPTFDHLEYCYRCFHGSMARGSTERRI